MFVLRRAYLFYVASCLFYAAHICFTPRVFVLRRVVFVLRRAYLFYVTSCLFYAARVYFYFAAKWETLPKILHNSLQKKIEPNDINKSIMLDLERLDAATEKDFLGYYHLYRQSVLDKKPDERFIALMNKVFVGCFT